MFYALFAKNIYNHAIKTLILTTKTKSHFLINQQQNKHKIL